MAGVSSLQSELDLVRVRHGGPGVDAVGAEAGEVDGGAWRSIVGAGQLQEIVDERTQAVGLLDRSVELRQRNGGEATLQVLEAKSQRGQRRAQLVRGVGDERVLGGQQLIEPRSHRGDRVGQRAQLGWTAGRFGRDGEVTLGEPVGVGLQPTHRTA